MNHYTWPVEFKKIFKAAMERHKEGTRDPGRMFLPVEQDFLECIGATTQEIFDFVDDHCRYGEPDFEMVLLVTAARRDYFLTEQKGVRSTSQISMDTLPSKQAELDGIEWLPRIIEKARAKLRGEMPADLMYGCGGDRPFLKSVNVAPADFLRVVWAARDNTQKIIDYVKAHQEK